MIHQQNLSQLNVTNSLIKRAEQSSNLLYFSMVSFFSFQTFDWILSVGFWSLKSFSFIIPFSLFALLSFLIIPFDNKSFNKSLTSILLIFERECSHFNKFILFICTNLTELIETSVIMSHNRTEVFL